MKLVCVISHLNFLASCFKKNLYPKYLNVISEHFNFGFANDDIKESLNQLDQKAKWVFKNDKMSNFKLTSLQAEEDISKRKNKLSNGLWQRTIHIFKE